VFSPSRPHAKKCGVRDVSMSRIATRQFYPMTAAESTRYRTRALRKWGGSDRACGVGARGYAPVMDLVFGTRESDSPLVRSVWTCTSEQVSEMTSVASETVGLVFWEQHGRRFAAVTGPESRTATAPVPEGARFVGIQFAVGASLRMAPTTALVDSGIVLPDVCGRRFFLDGAYREMPGPDDAEALVERLADEGVVVLDPLVAQAARGTTPAVSPRTLERRFRAATGHTRGAVRRIERARAAAVLLSAGETTAEVIDKLGYYDEPHLARALRRYVGRTAGQLRTGTGGALALDTAQRTTS